MLFITVNYMNVLLLSDFSEVAINATHYAMDLLQNEEVNFTLLNIHIPNPEASEEAREQSSKAIKASMDERVEKLRVRSSSRKHKILGCYREEPLVKAARMFIEGQHVDLLVMGAVGKEFRNSTILGNHTYEIMTKIKCNILAIPEDVRFKGLGRILMPIDFVASLQSGNLQFLENKRWFEKSRLSVWEITPESPGANSIKEYISQNFGGMEVGFSQLKKFENLNKILWIEVQKKFDLVVMLGKNLKICDRLMHSKHGLYASFPNRIPILVLHD